MAGTRIFNGVSAFFGVTNEKESSNSWGNHRYISNVKLLISIN